MGDIITRGYLHCIDMYYNMHVYHHKHGITCENKVKNHSIFMVFGPYLLHRGVSNGILQRLVDLLYASQQLGNITTKKVTVSLPFFDQNQ